MPRDITNMEDMLDVRDIIARFEELEDALVAADEEHAGDWAKANPDDATEYTMLKLLLEALAGYGGDEKWRGDWYPVTLIRESYFVKAMQELCEDIGDFPDGVPSYYVIDWDATARNLRVDYSTVEYDGVDYLYR